MQTMPLAVDLGFGVSFENGYLLITVMRVQRYLCAGWKASQARRDVLRTGFFGDEGNGLNAISALDHWQRIDSQNVRFCHGGSLLLKSRDLCCESNSGFEGASS